MKNKETSEYARRIGQNIRRIRLDCGMTQSDLDCQGISRSYICKVEKGEHFISLEKLRTLALIFGVNPSDFFKDPNGEEIQVED